MDTNQIACCGSYCGDCEWKSQTGCKGCQASQNQMFWGTCRVAECCFSKGYSHCGECPEMPCELLLEAFNHPEHGDNGERIDNLRRWSSGNMTVIRIGTYKYD